MTLGTRAMTIPAMVLLVCILKDYRRVEEVLLGFLEMGVTGATVLDARGMGQAIGNEVPIFASLRGLFPGAAVDSHVIISAMDRGRAIECFDFVERICGPLDQAGTGIVFTVPIDQLRGLTPEIG